MTEPIDDNFLARQGRTDEDLETRRRKAIRQILGESKDGLGFNELLDELKDRNLISRATLHDRLEQYSEEGWIENPDDWRPGQKKIFRLTASGTRPEEIDQAYKDWLESTLGMWQEALGMYRSEGRYRTKVLEQLFNEMHRYFLANTVVAENQAEFKSRLGNIELPANAIPPIDRDVSDTGFYTNVAAELYKFYTEKIFGEVYIHTREKASSLQEDLMLETFYSTQFLRGKIDEIWQESDVPYDEKAGRGE